MSQLATIIGPEMHGQRMRLEEFEHAVVREGCLYELSRGVIQVSEVPHDRHGAQIDEARAQFYAHRRARPGKVHRIASGDACKIPVPNTDSERHPDIAIYLTPRPDVKNYWRVWIPAVVIEVVSASSDYHDYVEKREDYLAFGVSEYWIIDHAKQQMLALQRTGGQWVEKIVEPGETCTTHVLQDLSFDLAAVFAAVV